jgi:hypothetical protein
LVTVTAYEPVAAGALLTGSVGVTLRTIEAPLEEIEVTESVNGVPFAVFENDTVAPVSKPVPVIVTVFAPVPS